MSERQRPDTYLVTQQAYAKKKKHPVYIMYTYIPLVLSTIGYIFPTSSVGRPSITRRVHKVENNTLSHKIIGQLMQ